MNNIRDFALRIIKSTDFLTEKINIGYLLGKEDYDFTLAGYTALMNMGCVFPGMDTFYLLTDAPHKHTHIEYYNRTFYPSKNFVMVNSLSTQTIKDALEFILIENFNGNLNVFEDYILRRLSFGDNQKILEKKLKTFLNERRKMHEI